MTLRDLIIKARSQAGMTQGELAEKAGLSQPQISDFESGKREMRSDNLDKVLSVLNLTLNTYDMTNGEQVDTFAQCEQMKLEIHGR